MLYIYRFPVNALQVYSEHSDFQIWKSRLRIFQPDLQDLTSINNFLAYVEKTIPHLDILINNAAQTIWRPASFYRELCKEELPKILNNDFLKICSVSSGVNIPSVQSDYETEYEPGRKCLKTDNEFNLLKNVPNEDLKYFPSNQYDNDGQQLDLRPLNSWNLGLTDIPLRELLQTLTINSIAPFLLTSKLKPLLQRSPNARKFVVNVSAMEGQFSRVSKVCEMISNINFDIFQFQGSRHPHTNMAKAALNMMTRTSGLELELDKIYMTAVDTGWCTDERPHRQAQYEADGGFVVPLTTEDGAARVYHPILHGLKENNLPYFSVFLKNFKPHPW